MDVRVRCIAFYHDKLVLIHRVRHNDLAEFYIFPGGGVDEGELPEQTCVREMLEEVSLTVTPIKLLGIQLQTDRNGDHCQMYYLVDVVSGMLAEGMGTEYTEPFRSTHGKHDPVALTIDEFCAAPTIHPGRIREQLMPYIKNIREIPFFILDDRIVC